MDVIKDRRISGTQYLRYREHCQCESLIGGTAMESQRLQRTLDSLSSSSMSCPIIMQYRRQIVSNYSDAFKQECE